jgi:HEAT repeat protein
MPPSRLQHVPRWLLLSVVLLIGVWLGRQEDHATGDWRSAAAESDSREFCALIAKLRSPSAANRAAAAERVGELGEKGTPAIPVLMDLLKDTSPVGEGQSVADVASATLAEMGKPAAEACLNALIENPAREQSDMFRRTIGRFTDQGAIDVFIRHMTVSDPKARNVTVIALACSDDPRLIPGLIACFRDSDRYVRLSAVGHFRSHRDRRAVEPLMEALVDDDETMQVRAAEALATQDDRRAIPALLGRIQDDTEDARTHRSAAQALGKIGGSDVFEILVAIVAKGPPTGQRPGAGTALDYDGRRVSADLQGRRYGAVQGLGHLGDRRASEMLRSILRNRDEYGPLRLAAASSLWMIEGAKELLPVMTQIVTDPSEPPIVRLGLATALVKQSNGVIDDVTVVTALGGWVHIKSHLAQEGSIETMIPALDAVAERGATAEVRAAARERLVEAKQRLRQLRGE